MRQSILDLLQRLPQAAAIVTSAAYEVLAWNDLAAALMEDFSVLPRGRRNLVRRVFLGPGQAGRGCTESPMPTPSPGTPRGGGGAAARYPDAPEVTELVDDLAGGNPSDIARR